VKLEEWRNIGEVRIGLEVKNGTGLNSYASLYLKLTEFYYWRTILFANTN